MNNQSSVYYIVAAAMISIGFLMTTNLFDLTTGQMNAINLGAAYVTLSTALMGVLTYKRVNSWIKFFGKVNLLLGIILVFLGLIMEGFKEDLAFIKILGDFDTNPLVLVCLGITVGSIVLLDSYNRRSASIKEIELEKKIKQLEAEKLELEKGVIRATTIIESMGRKKDE